MTGPILVDCDGVLSDFSGACLDLAAEKFNVYAVEADITQWDIAKAIGCPGLYPEVSRRVIENEFCYRLRPHVGGLDFLRELETLVGKENVLVCTSPWNAEWMSQRAAWLEDVARVPLARQIQCSRKDLVSGYLVDDRASTISERGSGFCIARPWNVDVRGARGDYRACLATVRSFL
jgi:5'(3')-deoxyribonucleotidase